MNRSIKTASMTIAIVSELCKLYDHGLLSLTEAVARSGLKKRTFQRRVKAWREGGEAALIHGNTGHACSFRISEELRNHIVELIREKYWDHGAQLLSEQLAANEDIRISKWLPTRISASLSLNSPVHVRRTVESVPGGVIAAPIPAMPYRDRGTPF